MKKWITRSLAVLICLFVFAGVAATEAKAADVIIQGECTGGFTNARHSYVLDSDGVLTISGTTDMNDAHPWDEYADSIKKVVIEPGVKSIGSCAFSGCKNLTEVSIPNTVTKIKVGAFEGCIQLESIDLPESITEIAYRAFQGAGLVSISIPEGVTAIYETTFDGCFNLQSVELPDTLTQIAGYYAFRNCTSLTEITIPDSVTSIGSCAFKGCTALREVSVPNSVAEFGDFVFSECTGLTRATFEDGCLQVGRYMFEGCTNLTTVTFPDTLEKIEDRAFRNCSSLKNVELPAGLDAIGSQTFQNCDSLTEIAIPAVPVIESYMFQSCDNLSDITISEGTLTIKNYAFDECNSLEWITIPASVTSMAFDAFGDCDKLDGVIFQGDAPTADRPFSSTVTRCYYPAGNSTWIDINVRNLGSGVFLLEEGTDLTGACGTRLTWTLTRDNVLTISGNGGMPEYTYSSRSPWNGARKFIDTLVVSSGVNIVNNYAFYDCYNLQTVSLASSVKKINANAFACCDNLEEINIPAAVVEIGNRAFYECGKLKNVTLPSGLTTIGNEAFYDCDSITTVQIPNSVTSLGQSAFNACDELKTATVAGSVGKIHLYTFQNCANLTNVTLGSGITQIATNAFNNCAKLETVTLPDTLEKIDNNAFYGCAALKSVTIPAKVSSIGSSAFKNCLALETVILPERLTTITNYVFECCENLKEITIPASVTSIYSSAFKDCNVLEEIHFEGNAPSINSAAFTNVFATAYYPANDATWTSDKFKDYGGLIEWVAENRIVLTAPELTKISNASSGVKLTWNKVNDAAKYQVFVKTTQNGAWSKVATTTKTSYTYTKAQSNKIYYMTVKAVDSTGTIVSDCNETGLKIRFLSQPALSKIANTASGVKLTWSEVSGATEYQILAKTSKSGSWKKVATTSETSYTYTSVESGKYCYMTVKAVKGTTASAYDTTGLNIRFLSRPTLSKIATTSNGVKLTWNKVTGATEYQVLAKTSKSGSWKKVAITSSTSYTYKAESGKYCYMTVKAVNGSSVSTYNSTGLNVKFLAQPTISKLSNTSKGIKITWGKVTGAQKYQVLVKTSQNGTWKSVGTTTKTDVTYTKAQSGKTYYFSVKAIADDGKTVSTYSTTGTKLLFLSQPEITRLKSTTKGVSVTWEASQGAGQYKVYVKTSKDGEWTSVGTTSKTSFTYTKAKSGKTYYFSVRAMDKDGKIASSYDTAGMKIQFKK